MIFENVLDEEVMNEDSGGSGSAPAPGSGSAPSGSKDQVLGAKTISLSKKMFCYSQKKPNFFIYGKVLTIVYYDQEKYDDIYFDSDEEGEGGDKRKVQTNEDLLYDPDMDDDDQNWVDDVRLNK